MGQLKHKDVEAKFEIGLAEAEAKVLSMEHAAPPLL